MPLSPKGQGHCKGNLPVLIDPSLFLSWCCKKQVVDLEEENLWPELLDSGKMEICISNR